MQSIFNSWFRIDFQHFPSDKWKCLKTRYQGSSVKSLTWLDRTW